MRYLLLLCALFILSKVSAQKQVHVDKYKLLILDYDKGVIFSKLFQRYIKLLEYRLPFHAIVQRFKKSIFIY